jgi:hypothetical protein
MGKTYRYPESKPRKRPEPKFDTGERLFYFPSHGKVQETLEGIFEKDEPLKPYQRLRKRDHEC